MTNEEKIRYVFVILHKTKVPLSYLARLTMISRATLHTWRNKPSDAADAVRVQMAYGAAVRLEKAFDQKLLPLKGTLPPKEKFAMVRTMVMGSGRQA